jgi:hypothetical protein
MHILQPSMLNLRLAEKLHILHFWLQPAKQLLQHKLHIGHNPSKLRLRNLRHLLPDLLSHHLNLHFLHHHSPSPLPLWLQMRLDLPEYHICQWDDV